MTIKIRDWLVLTSGVILTLLGGFQLAYDFESFLVRDFILNGIIFAIFGWLYFMYKYKQDKALFDEFYSEKYLQTLTYALGTVVIIVLTVIFIFEKNDMISVNYIYGAMRLSVGLCLLYLSFIVMRDSDHE